MQPKSTFSPLAPCLKIQWLHHSNAALLLATNKSVSTDRWEVFGLTDIKGRRTDVTHWWILCFTLCTVFMSVHVDQLIYLLVYWSLKVFLTVVCSFIVKLWLVCSSKILIHYVTRPGHMTGPLWQYCLWCEILDIKFSCAIFCRSQ